MHFRILVEGDTEKLALANFLKKWLDPPRLTKSVGIRVANFRGSAQYLKDVKSTTIDLLKAKSDLIAVIGLLDLYGLPDSLYIDKSVLTKTAQERADWCKNEIEKMVGQPKFYQFFAIHELEAWILSDSTNPVLPAGLKPTISKIKKPEEVNFLTPPAIFLKNQYKTIGRVYDKPIEGKKLFERLDPAKVYAKCPNFKTMLDKMLELAKAAGL
jgi:Domain of unknown function (DUF4276)